jgi:precorrin-8X/cobalt-precorrin-8 methylmutase
MDYLRDPAAIYAQSFAAIRAEADLAHLPPALHEVAVRMIHACGMPDLADDIVGDPTVVDAARAALASGAPVFCDCEMVRAGIIERHLPRDNERIVTLNDPCVPDLAARLGTTRSAAAVELWRDRLAGAVVVIGNAPTALFHLLDVLTELSHPSHLRGEAGGGGPSVSAAPAAIIATPVGFVGAAESKARLAETAPAPFVIVRGRRGGSAIASAAFNAIAAGGAP